MEYSSSAPNKSRHVHSAIKNHNTPWNSGFVLSETERCWSMEGDNVSNAGFIKGAWEEGFHPILSTIKTKQALSLICLNLHFELA